MKKNYEPKITEKEIYSNWEDAGFFEAKPRHKKDMAIL